MSTPTFQEGLDELMRIIREGDAQFKELEQVTRRAIEMLKEAQADVVKLQTTMRAIKAATAPCLATGARFAHDLAAQALGERPDGIA